MRAPLARYCSFVSDNARWGGLALRNGDIVISAPVKCGTTWVQMICALLIFQQRTLPARLDFISPWLDMLTRPLADVIADLEAQQHRRFVKSHTPLDGLPFDERVTYICIGRDPRDVALSLYHHMANMNVSAFLEARKMAVGSDDSAELASQSQLVPCCSERDWFWQWMEAAAPPSMQSMIHHLTTFWGARAHPNVTLLHYDDLKTDLEGQMRRLATLLGVTVPEPLWPELVQAATFDDMRRRASDVVPNSFEGLWHEDARFFNKGTSRQWLQLLDGADLARYQARVKQLADPQLAAWLHQGPILQ